MKAFRSTAVLLRRKPQLSGLFWQKAKNSLFLMLAAFVLSGVRLFSQPLPLAACLVGALPMGAQSIFAAFGAVLGYFLRCDAMFAAEYTALTLLMLAAVSVFQGTSLPAAPWFMPTLAAGVSAVLGGIGFLGGAAQIGFFVAKVALSALATVGFKKFLRTKNPLFICALLAAGFSGGAFDLGFLAACAFCCANGELATAAALGLALDLSGAYGQCAMAALIAPTLLQKNLPMNNRILRGAMYLLLPSSVFFCFGNLTVGIFAANLIGAVAGTMLQSSIPKAVSEENFGTAKTLSRAVQVLEMTKKQLPEKVFSPDFAEADEVYDAAAERMCRCCPRFHRCWEHRASQTIDALSAAAHRIIERGVARAEDFPKAFRENCCHVEGFVVAVNQELEGMLYRRRYRLQLHETRQVLIQTLDTLSQYLNAAQAGPICAPALFQPQVGVYSAAKGTGSVSGDRGACFSGDRGDFYILLCDGMGSGAPAAQTCSQTLRFLQKLLKNGIEPLSALKLLNGTEILGGGRYTTVDLLHSDLTTGETTLYKWGAAPSYLRNFDEIQTIGEQTSPPGVDVSQSPTVHRVDLKRQELLVLVTDGADAENVREILSAYRGTSPRELAALLAGTAHDDDMTAVAVALRHTG